MFKLTRSAFIVILFISIFLASCAQHAPLLAPDNNVEAYYKSSALPQHGMSRVYILPTIYHQMLTGDMTLSSDVSIGRSADDQKLIGRIGEGQFIAFDLPEGYYYLTAKPFNYDLASSSQLLFFPEGKIVMFRPIAHDSNALGLLGSLAQSTMNANQSQFDVIDTETGKAAIRSMHMSGVLSEAASIVKQSIPPSKKERQ
jgi:hypothetical protein